MTLLAVASLAVSAVSASNQAGAQADAKKDAKRALAEQARARSEQQAENSAKAAQERRQQLREERIKKAKIIQSSENTGVSMSSGESGSVGSLNTQVGTNIGRNLGSLQTSENISQANQNAADFMSSSQNHMSDYNTWGLVGSLGQSVFSAAGGFNTLAESGQSLFKSSGTYEATSDTYFK